MLDCLHSQAAGTLTTHLEGCLWVCLEHLLDLACPGHHSALQDVDLVFVLQDHLILCPVRRRQGQQCLPLGLPKRDKDCSTRVRSCWGRL